MKIDFIRKIKLFLYALSLAEIIIFGRLADKTGSNTKMMIIAAALLFVNVIVYKTVAKYYKKHKGKNGF
ncbi:MAG: hypothetical protein LBD46_00125 [Endomicrobium sp.]|jgi:fucose permease|nr:hypothetical protein [Endomicrobium sp.]